MSMCRTPLLPTLIGQTSPSRWFDAGWADLPKQMVLFGFVKADFALAVKIEMNPKAANDGDVEQAQRAIYAASHRLGGGRGRGRG